MDKICIGADEKYTDRALELASRLRIDYVEKETMNREELFLYYNENGLSLNANGQSMRGDFRTMVKRLQHNNLSHELLVKASKIKDVAGEMRLLDATAGMGEDSLILAAAGFKVDMYEYNPIIAALLEDALLRGRNDPDLAVIVSRMTVHNEDSIEAMRHLDYRPDCILLDPMFPARQKSSLVKKKFQLLQQLEQPCMEERELLEAATMAKPRKIIIKRMLKGPYLANIKPSYSITGKSIRYDCIMIN